MSISALNPSLFDVPPVFDGATYSPEHDQVRLTGQWLAVFELMQDGEWRTHRQIVEAIGKGSETGISARLRDLRKPQFGKHIVNRRSVGDREHGLYEYQLVVREPYGTSGCGSNGGTGGSVGDAR